MIIMKYNAILRGTRKLVVKPATARPKNKKEEVKNYNMKVTIISNL